MNADAVPANARSPRRTLGWLWLAALLLFLGTAHGNLESTDSGLTMHAARALWLRGDSGFLPPGQGEWLGERLAVEYIDWKRSLGEHAYGKRPREELFDLKKDPHQMQSVAADPAYAAVLARLRERLMDELERTGDPRLVDGGAFFETPPLAGPPETPAR